MNKLSLLFIAILLVFIPTILSAQHTILNYSNLDLQTKERVDVLYGGQASYLMYSNGQWLSNRNQPAEVVSINLSEIQNLTSISANIQDVEMITINLDGNSPLDANTFLNFTSLNKIYFTSLGAINSNLVESIITNLPSNNNITFIYSQLSNN